MRRCLILKKARFWRAFCYASVSYTHLDVYKRQVACWGLSRRASVGVTTALTDSVKRLFSSCSAMILSLAARSSSFAARSFFVSSVFSRFSSSVHGAELDIDSLKDAACGDDFPSIPVSYTHLLNADMLEAGQAWAYPAFCNAPFCNGWKKLEQDAKEARRGLWSRKDPTPPWKWRQKRK